MTPKEKAEELFTTYRFSLSLPNAPLGDDKDRVAKQCALIAVDEMLSLGAMVGSNLSDTFYIYWRDVKTEIEKL